VKYVRLILPLAFFVPVFSLLGAQGWGGYWIGWVVGGLIGAFIGLIFSGEANGKWLDIFYPPGPDTPKPRAETETADRPNP